ncbi:hypothetical protein MKQ68_14980 [Chitinophaga horti]|uniref:Uncharacterized protein n=1 Tax=Chitinophaga horti TaxID=2920382 RepID=A0ABY6IW16_9BACT|nr:hypothetical protein [Chitinophaga horti]UYQ91396.1 hypothetical protein MKQ68_14980 [Chitinophaga horti]
MCAGAAFAGGGLRINGMDAHAVPGIDAVVAADAVPGVYAVVAADAAPGIDAVVAADAAPGVNAVVAAHPVPGIDAVVAADAMPGVGALWQVRATSDLSDSLRTKSYTIRLHDTISFELKLVLDAQEKPLYYYRNIFTPVCLTGECKPVYINLYWDLLGNYQRFDFPPGEILTKADHKPFKQEDYEKLQGILANPGSIFGELLITDLTAPGTENLSDSADGKTGATPKKLKSEVIEGAVYTCFTLWHLANGAVKQEMEKITAQYESPALLHRFMQPGNHHYQYWAMERVINPKGIVRKGFEQDVQQVMTGDNLFTARHALQKVAPAFFSGDAMQRWLWGWYLKASYPLQNAILKKLTEVTLGDTLSGKLAGVLTASNNEQFKLMLAALAAQRQLSPKTQLQLAKHLQDPGPGDAASIHAVLKRFKPSAEVKTQIQQYEKNTL